MRTIITYIVSLILAVTPMAEYTEGVVGQPEMFLPGQATTQTDRTISRLLYKGLFKYDIYGVLVPDLAESWSISDSGIVYTITLKDNQYWSNGQKVSSDDLIYTAFKIPDLEGVGTDRVDDLTVRYILPNKYSPFLSLLTVGVLPNGALEKNDTLTPVSSGNFRVLRVEKRGDLIKRVTLMHNDNQSNIRKISFRYYSSEDELVTAARLGEIDAFLAREEHELQNFENQRFPLQGIYYSLLFNLNEETFTDKDLRTDLEKVLSVNDLIYLYGISVEGPVSRSLFTDTSIEFDKYEEDFSADLGGKELEFTVPDASRHTDLAEMVADIWEEKLNVNVKLRKVPPEDIVSRVITPRNFEVLLYGQEIDRDPDRYVYWHSTQTAAPNLNLSGFSHVRADRALEEGRNEPDNDKRVVHYNEFQEVVVQEVPAIFLYHPYTNYYVSQFVEGMGEKYTFGYEDRFLDFENWKRIRTN
ncbi:ABC transporter substrate-binding protein [bacterium]|nr:ABC transporter substrate-binding protein [bacterium]